MVLLRIALKCPAGAGRGGISVDNLTLGQVFKKMVATLEKPTRIRSRLLKEVSTALPSCWFAQECQQLEIHLNPKSDPHSLAAL